MARTTRQREAVRAVFADLDGFHSAQEVHARLRAAGDPVGLSTVYRAVQSLADDGELGRSTEDGGLWALLTRWDGVGSYRRALSAAEVKIAGAPVWVHALDEPGAFLPFDDVAPPFDDLARD